ncbi:hypothetical protein [Klebsiella pneumoniae]|uniref:hypothetical protein n=1 Tax=Klebsiella pneumoniae TaxID=573 RepID=UPI00388F79FA
MMNKTANKTTIVGAGALSIKDNQTPVIDTITDMQSPVRAQMKALCQEYRNGARAQ